MARTFIRQDVQIAQSDLYSDALAMGAALETGAGNIEDDLNGIRSALNEHIDNQGGKWYDALAAPGAFENGAARGINTINADLHNVERKRVLRDVHSLVDVTVGAGDNFVILGTGELPANTAAAVGAGTSLGTVAAFHAGTFGTHSLDEVAGPNAVQPKNLMLIVDGATRDPLVDSNNRQIYGLLQTETNGDHTITDTTTTRAQISFVTIDANGSDLIACAVADIENLVINYSTRERVGLEDLNEDDFLKGAIVDAPGGSLNTRQASYDNQGVTPVELGTNAFLDLAAGLEWTIRDNANAPLLRMVEGSGGGTTTMQVAGDVDIFDVNAVVNNFDAGISARTGGTRPIDVGVTDGVVESTAGNLEVLAANLLYLDDVNNPAGWSLDGMALSDAAIDWTTWETNFGEVSLMAGVNQAMAVAQGGGTRSRVQAVLTANVAANLDVNGPGTPHANTDVDLLPFDSVPNGFVEDVFVYLNGELLRNNPVAGANDVYPGGTPTDGDLRFTFGLKGTGGKPDQLTVVVFGQ